MRKKSLAVQSSFTLRNVPADLVLTVKYRVADYNVKHPGHKITQGDLVAKVVLDWEERGGQLPSPETWDDVGV